MWARPRSGIPGTWAKGGACQAYLGLVEGYAVGILEHRDWGYRGGVKPLNQPLVDI